MSNAQEHHSEEHQAVVKTPRQLITVVILAFIVPIVVIVLLIAYVTNQMKVGAGSDALSTAAIDARIAPVAGFELIDVSAPTELRTGDAVYQQVCAACHSTGVAGAPATGNADQWAPRIATGYDSLLASTIHGKGAMPPKGGATKISDFEIERAMVYLVNQAGANFPEPATPEGEGEATEATNQAAAPAAPATAAAAAPAQAAPAAAPVAPVSQAAPAAPAPAAAPAAPVQVANAGADIQISPEAATVGKQTYDQVCMVCHAAGIAGAPKTGVRADWEQYLPQGLDGMLQVVLQGKGAMPPRGGAANATDEQLSLAIQYMISGVL